MKKIKSENPLKAARKQAKEDIQKRLSKVFKTITNELGQDAKNLSIDIEKESKKLAKKIAKGLSVGKEAKETPAASANTAPAKPSVVKAAKPVAKKPVVAEAKKPVVKAAPAKTVAPKVKAVKNSAPKPVKK
jgi:hypothetical protein